MKRTRGPMNIYGKSFGYGHRTTDILNYLTADVYLIANVFIKK